MQRRNIGMIFQEFNLIERLSVMDNVLSGRLGYTGTLRSILRMYTKDDVAQALRLLDRVGLSRARRQTRRPPFRRPASTCRHRPRSDPEPEAAAGRRADLESRPEDFARGDDPDREIAAEFHIPVLCNIHDVDLACDFCTRVIGLQDGIKKFEGTPAELDKAALQDIYAMEVL